MKTYTCHVDRSRTYKDYVLVFTHKDHLECQRQMSIIDQNVMAFERLYVRAITKLLLFTFFLGWIFVSFLWAIPITLITFLITNTLTHVLFRRSMMKRQLKVKLEELTDTFEDYTSYHETDHTSADLLYAIVGGSLFMLVVIGVNLAIGFLSLNS